MHNVINATDTALAVYYTRCPHHHVAGATVLCCDPCRPDSCRRPGECCWDCEDVADCRDACPDAAASAAREIT